MKDTLKKIIASIADNSDTVDVAEEENEGTFVFTVTVAKEDMGKIIGKEGKVIRAIRNVMKIPAIKANKRVEIALQES